MPISLTSAALRSASRVSAPLSPGSRTSRRFHQILLRAPSSPCPDTRRGIREFHQRWRPAGSGASCRSGDRWRDRRRFQGIRDGRARVPFRLPPWSGTRRKYCSGLLRPLCWRSRVAAGRLRTYETPAKRVSGKEKAQIGNFSLAYWQMQQEIPKKQPIPVKNTEFTALNAILALVIQSSRRQ